MNGSSEFAQCDKSPRTTSWLGSADFTFLAGALIGLLAIRVLLMFWLPFTDTTEARYVEIARKMLETAEWITPQFEYGIPFWGKPPLHTWLSALGMKVFGVGHFGGRILIFMTALGTLGLIYNWVRFQLNAGLALVATVVAASLPLFFGSTALVMTDMVMVFGTTLSMIGFHRCVTSDFQRAYWGHVFFVGLAIGMLAKGPVAVALTAIPMVTWLLIGKRWHRLGDLPWVGGLLLASVIALPWYVLAELNTPGFLNYFIVGEHIERFLTPGWRGNLYGLAHNRAKGMIVLYGLGASVPWIVFGVALLLKPRKLVGVLAGRVDGLGSYLALWSVAPLVLFLPAANILGTYVLPGIPAATFLLVLAWDGVHGAPGKSVRMLFASTVLATMGLFALVTVLTRLSPDTLSLKSEQALIEEVQAIAPTARLVYYPSRSYSAEFYARGQVTALASADALDGLRSNGRIDAVAVRNVRADEARAILGPTFDSVGRIGRHELFVENPPERD